MVVFDKTGTLTVGRPEVVSVVLFSTFPMQELCDVAIAIEVSALVIQVDGSCKVNEIKIVFLLVLIFVFSQTANTL